MFLTKYNPLRELNELERKMVAGFPSFSAGFPSLSFEGDLLGFSPVVNTREGEFAYHVEADLPGVEKEDIKVDVKDNILTISGERKHKEEVKREDYYKLESSYGKFERSFTLPKGVDAENIQAVSEKGVLEVIIPKLKSETKKSKKIKVK
ncbi:HSP20 family protein [Epsilonproteobacteria bacterium SCGC AD-308-P11]|jgi:HSP20 family protein|nr:HSP20 family protein [Epsilonproteobacteria bacterium SCGC AD-308-P11]SMP87473.1 HSP20 family protein [Epsilonproteobacteria bacterium SCGC AD-308-E02]